MKRNNHLESKHVQNGRDRYGKKIPQQYPYTPYKCPLPVYNGVTKGDISQFCKENAPKPGYVTFTTGGFGFQNRQTMIVGNVNLSSATIYLVNEQFLGISEKENDLKELAMVAYKQFPDQYDMDEHWNMMERGMVKEWERRQTKLYKAMK